MVSLRPATAAGDNAANGDFRKFCADKIEPGLELFEWRRRRVLKLGALAVGCAGGCGVIFTWFTAGALALMLPILGLGFLVCAGLAWVRWRSIRQEYKGEILRQVVTFIGPNMNYLPEAMVDRRFFVASRLFQHRIDDYEGEDYVEGTLGQTDFQFSEIHAQYKTESEDSKGRTSTQWHTIFRGIYFVADFNKHFSSTTVVLPDTAERLFGFLGKALQSWNVNRDKLIRLEDPEFEKAFVVYGEDQVEARYILTPALMQRMLALRKKFGTNVHFSFTGSSVHMAIPTRHDHFEPRLFSSALDLTHIESFLDDLHAITGIIEDLNLNTRIWTKA